MDFEDFNPSWTTEEMLEQDGIFRLKDVADKMAEEGFGGFYDTVNTVANRINKVGGDPQSEMGFVRVSGNRLGIFMPKFRSYIQSDIKLQLKRIDPNITLNKFLRQARGYYRLSDFCKILLEGQPIGYRRLYHVAKTTDESRESLGLFHDKDAGFIIEMPKFAKFIKKELKAYRKKKAD